MNIGLYQGAAAMRSSEKRLEVIAQNLANVDTAGYKRAGTAAHAFRVPDAGSGPGRRGLKTDATVDWTQGNLQRTGGTFDLALFGEGFFAIDAPEGEAYTRDGSFLLDPGGVLVTQDGLPVVWEQRNRLIDPAGLPIVVDGEGQITQGGELIGRLRLVDFADRTRLAQNARGHWEAPPRAERRAHTAAVHQGALERSNANGLEEVVAMVTVQRAFESASTVMSTINDSYERLTRSGS